MFSTGTVSEMNPRLASGTIGATTTMWPQQHRQPSPAHPWSESFVVWVEKRQAGGENRSHAKISVAARSRTKTVTTLRTVGQSAMEPYAFYSATRVRQTYFPSAIKVLDGAGTGCSRIRFIKRHGGGCLVAT
jgi:hypothetical protein